MTTAPRIRVGVVGAGPWATFVHAPMFARSDRCDLVGIWSRRPEPGEQLARANHTSFVADFDELCERVDALSFCVPPDTQAELAVRAARRGVALLLEKPLALDLASARSVVEAAAEANVVTQVLLTWRYSNLVREFLSGIPRDRILGARGEFINNAFGGGPFATPWRLANGPLMDLGPHLIDLLEASLGPVVHVTAKGQRLGWVGLLLEHQSGAVSQGTLCATSPGSDEVRIEVATTESTHRVDLRGAVSGATIDCVVDEFCDGVQSRRARQLDAAHGLHIQRLLDDANSQLL